jgi:hypothetical protein
MFPYLASEKPAEAAALLLLSSREKKFKFKWIQEYVPKTSTRT